MNILEMYKRLSKEDKSNLTIYSIYDSIYDVAKNENFEISDKIVEANNYEEYLNKVIDTKEVLVSEIIPDVYSRL